MLLRNSEPVVNVSARETKKQVPCLLFGEHSHHDLLEALVVYVTTQAFLAAQLGDNVTKLFLRRV